MGLYCERCGAQDELHKGLCPDCSREKEWEEDEEGPRPMNERRMEEFLVDAIVEYDDNGQRIDLAKVRPFKIVGRNRGIVVALESGDEFQLTIVQSKRGG